MTTALEFQGVHKSFDGNPALVDAFFTAERGEVHALLGENGAGKSTLMNIACGLYSPDHGVIKVNGESAVIDGPLAANALGIGMVHQHFKLVENMTVAENVAFCHMAAVEGESLNAVRKRIAETSREIDFEIDPDRRIDTLSVSEQQRTEIIKVMMGGADILILDEPTAVLTDEESTRLLEQMQFFARQGKSVILITHKLREVFSHADKVTVMRGGKTVAAGREPGEMSPAELSRLMVGEAAETAGLEPRAGGEVVLELKHVSAKRANGTTALADLSIKLHAGQVYGLAGVGGNGQTELAETLMGIRQMEDGEFMLGGAALKKPSPRELRNNGVKTIPAERYIYGLAGDLSVMDNFVVSHLGDKSFGASWWINRRALLQETQQAIQDYEILGAGPATRARLLSGGNAQKLVLAREMSGESRVLLAHSPTRGLDVRACAAVHEYLRDAAGRGVAILLISEDLDEVLAVSDRVGVINRGRLLGEFDAPVEREAVGHLMVGHA
ncbi:MAG: ABC transporter ATP-binding protein [Rhodospirillaceae bacterium]|nr:ABC transporter ATP-binding protein [Rhodospirillaceae bacterium]